RGRSSQLRRASWQLAPRPPHENPSPRRPGDDQTHKGASLMYKEIFKTDETVDAAPLLEEFERTMSQRLQVLYKGLDAWTGVTLYRRNGENELPQMPALSRLIEQIGLEHVAAVFFYKLKAGAKQHEHRDMQGNLLFGCSRVHITLRTNPGAKLIIEGIPYHLPAGEVWCLDTSGRHAAVNLGEEDRIHLV